jgi:hypothetical protein
MNFRNFLESSGLDAIVADIVSRHPGLRLDAYETREKIELMSIELPRESRGVGVGTEVIRELQGYARSVGKPIVLRPEAERGRKGDLERFYRGLGFIHNRGRNVDFVLSSPTSRTMYWRPLDESVRVTDRWPLNKDTYDMDTPEGRRRYEDELRDVLAGMGGGSRKVVSEEVVREPYTITCWRGFNQYSYDRDVSERGGRLFIDSGRAMEGILWFSHSLQAPSAFSSGGPREHALSYARKYDVGYLLTYPLRCTRVYKAVRYEDGRVSSERLGGLGSEWTGIEEKSYLLPRGWSLTWQTQMFMSFRGSLEIDESMLTTT